MDDRANKKHQCIHIFSKLFLNFPKFSKFFRNFPKFREICPEYSGVPSLSNSPSGLAYHAGFHSFHSNKSPFDIYIYIYICGRNSITRTQKATISCQQPSKQKLDVCLNTTWNQNFKLKSLSDKQMISSFRTPLNSESLKKVAKFWAEITGRLRAGLIRNFGLKFCNFFYGLTLLWCGK